MPVVPNQVYVSRPADTRASAHLSSFFFFSSPAARANEHEELDSLEILMMMILYFGQVLP
jgi:hypothetical protein